MGYYTLYTLDVVKGNATVEEVVGKFKEEYDLPFFEDGEAEHESKWYSHREDMLKITQHYPDVLFKLTGSGEDNEDIWIEYYKNGKYQSCPAIITFDKFDESKLKTT